MDAGLTSTPGEIDLSVIIVNYNVKDYLLQCLRSLDEACKPLSAEIIVVDNNSTDGSVEDLSVAFRHVQWHALTENVGFGRANNIGLEHARGRYVLFLNPDTIVGQETLLTMVRHLDTHPNVGMAGCKVLNPDGSFQVACRRGLPTPWASFCKLFGLQAMFPSVKLFSSYNLMYRSIDETYSVDALIGAFMMGRTDLVRSLEGFDPEFFMYGEDIDLCYRVKQAGFDVQYVHETSIIHYKGESTKRSSLNEVRVFYEAMEIFARKHFGGSKVFLAFLRIGISVRSVLARLARRRVEVLTWIVDMLCVNASLLIATTVRFERPFGFPDYAYPIVPIMITLIGTLSLVAVGEYVEYRPTIRRSAVGLLTTFFVLSSLTYFFKDFGFSRGVLLMTMGLSGVLFAITRAITSWMDAKGRSRTRRIVLVGLNEHSTRLADALSSAERRNAEVVGIVATAPFNVSQWSGMTVLGDTSYLGRILDATGAQEVILTDTAMPRNAIMQLMMASSSYRARFHIAQDYDDVVTARIINDVAGLEPTVTVAPLLRFRNRVAKRMVDICLASLVLPLTLLALILPGSRRRLGQWWEILCGRMSIVGLWPDGVTRTSGKPGLTGLVHISRPATLSASATEQLNTYYVDAYTLALDVEIILKHLFRRNRANDIRS
ncbi:MAG: glycosyltransferase [Candidatus Kapabacteria bacterium]|nr:glycosyltransferase [Candidatus Kapabacteria bacterium]